MSKNIKIVSIAEIVDDYVDYVKNRQLGVITSVKTGLNKLDSTMMDGIEWNRVITIAGMSRSGKSMLTEQLKRNIIDNNSIEIDILSLDMEMLPIDQVARNVSSKTDLSIKEMYSADGKFLDSAKFDLIKKKANELKKYPIFYCGNILNADQVKSVVYEFVKQRKIEERKAGLIITLDHIALCDKISSHDDKQTVIENVCHALVEIKKDFASRNQKVICIIVSQFNRSILSSERVLNPKLHFPDESDLYASSAIMQDSDYVFGIHKPALIPGLSQYGVGTTQYPRGLPLFNPQNEKQAMVYLHVIKGRFGASSDILMMVDNYEKAQLNEYNN